MTNRSDLCTRLPLGGLLLGPFGNELGELGDVRTADGPRVINVGNQKLAYILDEIREGSQDPKVVELARRIVADVIDKDDVGEIRAVWQWLVENVRYVRDPKGMEVMQSAGHMIDPRDLLPPSVSKRLPKQKPTGDCDEMGAILPGALLRSIGYDVRIALWAKPRGAWQHIFILAHAPSRHGWVVVDPTMKTKPFGWLPPMGRWTAHRFDDDHVTDKRIIAAGNGQTAAELAGFFDDLWKGIKGVAGNVWEGVKSALPAVATVGASMIPGIGTAGAGIVGNLVNGLVNKGQPNASIAAAQQAMRAGDSPLAVIGAVAGQQVPGIGVFAQQALSRMYTADGSGRSYLYQLPQLQQPAPSPQQAEQNARQVAPLVAYNAQTMAPAMADATMMRDPRLQQYDPQARSGQYYPLFVQQAQTDYGQPQRPQYPPQWQQPQQQAYPQQQPQQWQQQPQAPAYPPQQQAYPQQQQPYQQSQQWPAPPPTPQPQPLAYPPQQQYPPRSFNASPWQAPTSWATGPTYAPAYAGLLAQVFDDEGVATAARAGESLAELSGCL